MNLIDMLKGPLTSGESLGKLGGLLGVDAAAAQRAVSGGIPALLAGLAGSAGTREGADKLVKALGQADAGILGKLGGLLGGGGGGAMAEQGGNILGSLLSGGTLSGIIAALSKYSGVGMEGIKKLLGMLAPLVLGGLASQFKGKAPTAEGLTSLFAEQKANIASALPGGLSLDGIPGLGNVSAAAKQVAGAAADTGSKMLLPLAIILLGAVAAWYFWLRPKANVSPTQPAIPSKPLSIPEPIQLTRNLSGVYTTLTDALNTVKDAATADAALPGLKDVDGRLNEMKSLWDKLPDAGKSAMKAVTGDSLAKFKELVAKVLAMPGVGEKLKPVLDGIVAKLGSFAG